MRVSVIIPTYNRPDMLRRALSSIARQSLATGEFEVLVVDDGSDGPPMLSNGAELPFQFSVLRQAHQGPTVARNLGASESRGEVLVFLDDDICIAERSLEGIASLCGPSANVIALGRLVTPEAAKKSVFARVMSANECRAMSGQPSREVPFTECKTGLMGVRREAFAALGGFHDPGGGWPNWDDVDFAYRASQRGFRFLQSDEISGEHWDYALTDLTTACERWRRASRAAVHLIRKHPAIQSHLPMFDDKTALSSQDPPALLLRKLARRTASRATVLAALERLAAVLERRYPTSPLLPPLYRWIIGSHIFLGFQQGQVNARREKFGEPVILVYSMGKVGSTTVSTSISRQHPEIPLHQVHFLSDYWIKEKLPNLDPEFHRNIAVAKAVYASLEKRQGRRIKVITLVREPLAREIADIFQNWKGLLHIDSIHDVTVTELQRYLDRHDHAYALNWFDTEFKAYLGFDIFSMPFEKERGYSIYKTERADVLCLKTEKLDRCMRTAIKELCGLDIVGNFKANTSASKDGKELYSELKRGYKAPKEKLEALYNSKLVRHFYTDAEIDAFTRQWSKGEWGYADLRTSVGCAT